MMSPSRFKDVCVEAIIFSLTPTSGVGIGSQEVLKLFRLALQTFQASLGLTTEMLSSWLHLA